jgi:uncharacterized protein (TIGR02099 family)
MNLGYRLYRIFGWTTITVAILLLSLRLLTPLFAPKVDQLSDWVASEFPYPLAVKEITLTWEGLSPAVTLFNVDILNSSKQPALHVNKMKFHLNLAQLLFKKLQIDQLMIEGASASIEYQSNGLLFVADLPELQINVNNTQSSTPFPLKKIQIKNSALTFIYNNKRVSLEDINASVALSTKIKVRSEAALADHSGKLHIQADIPFFGKQTIIYAHWQGENIGQIGQFFQNYPVTVLKGSGDIQIWYQQEEKNKVALYTNIDMRAVELQGKAEDPLNFDSMKGIFIAKNHDANWQVTANDWHIVESGVNQENESMDFSLVTKLEMDGRLWELKARNIDLYQWSKWSTSLSFLPDNWVKNLDKYQYHGQLDYIHAQMQSNQQGIKPILGEIVFTDFGMNATQEYPGVSSISGATSFHDDKGKMVLQSEHLLLDYPKVYVNPLTLSKVSTIISWMNHSQGVDVKINALQATVNEAMLTGEAKIKFNDQSQKPELELLLSLGKMSTNNLLALLPKKVMDTDLTNWLDTSLLTGTHLATTCVFRGNLADFPFDNAEGAFEIYTELDDVHLDYMQGWPALTDLKANLLFRNRALFISAERGNIAQSQLSDADAVVPDLFSATPELVLDTKLMSTLQTGLVVVKNSPLPSALKNTLAPLNLQGDMVLSLGLEIPLSKKSSEELKVRGLIEVNDASVDFKELHVPITSLQGEVSFTENSINSDKLTGLLLDSPTHFTMSTHLTPTQPEIHLGARGKISVDKLKKIANIADIQHVSGETDYTAQVIFQSENTSQATLNIASNLQGISIDAPYPFSKKEQDSSLLEFKMYFDSNELMRIALKYGDSVTLAYSLASQNKTWQPVGGQIHFGENRLAKFREDQIVLIDGDLLAVDFQEWKQFLTSVGFLTKTSHDTSQPQLEPLVELNIKKLTVYGLPFEQEKIEARWDGGAHQWNLHFEGQNLQGYATIPEEDTGQISVDLKKLALLKSMDFPELPNAEQHANLRPIEIKIKELVMDKRTITDIKARLEPSWKGYFFPNVTAKLKATDITLSGNWDYLSTHKKVSTEGSISTKNISETLGALGMQGTVRNAKGTVDFTLSWNGSPMKIDYPTLGGQADFSLSQGIIHGVNPGIGRVLSLLNLDNVHRRLNLDFSDVTKNGLAFNELTGKFQFGKGKVSSNKVVLNGPSAKIEAFGQADLENQGLNGEMIVMPNVTGSLPVAAAIAAGNPAVGAAVWVVDKMLGKKIQQIHRVRYKVLGTWAQPKVEEVSLPARG